MNPDQQVKALYQEFKRLHPNAKEAFLPTNENVTRWMYHIKEAKKTPHLKPMPIKPTASAKAWQKSRVIKTWKEMPEYMRERYLAIAGHFPFVQCYAVGSRIDGTYIEQWHGAREKMFREQLGKDNKTASDYDVFVPNGKKANAPSYADVLQTLPKGSKKIAIPMWDFSKLPAEEHQRVIDLFNASNWGELLLVHNRYALSQNVYCCDALPIIRYFSTAIENGTIKPSTQEKAVAKLVE